MLACLAGGSGMADDHDPTIAAIAAFEQRQQQLRLLGDPGARVKSLQQQVFAAGFEAVDDACVADTDGDSLPDCVETATGVFVDISDTGTDPGNPDSDGDGLSDGDEVVGTAGGLDLPALGVNPLRRDLLVEYDWFDDSLECGSHSHAPPMAVLERVAAVFAAAPLENPDGSRGINLIQDVGQGGPLTGGGPIGDADAVLPGAFDDHYRQIKQRHFDDARRGYFRYVMMPHRYAGGSNSSGYAELIGDDVIVSLYCHRSDDNVARTIIHELGHNLGLHHGGFEACNGKPNYNSIMNYRYQFTGRDESCNAAGDGSDGFSDGNRLALDENALDENVGVCGNPAIDWNLDGVLQPQITRDLNPAYEGECGSGLRRLLDFDDWGNVTLAGVRPTSTLKSLQQEVSCAGAPAPKSVTAVD